MSILLYKNMTIMDFLKFNAAICDYGDGTKYYLLKETFFSEDENGILIQHTDKEKIPPAIAEELINISK